MATTDYNVLSAIDYYSTSIIDVLNGIIALLNTGKTTIKFNSMGGSEIEDIIVYNGQSVGSLPVPTKDGYNFDGWYLYYREVNGIPRYSNRVEDFAPVDFATNPITLYAKWVYASYTLYFDPVDGTVNPSSKRVTYQEPYGELPSAYSPLSTFSYWVDDSNDRIYPHTIYRKTEDSTLSAVYDAAVSVKLWLDYDYYTTFDVEGTLSATELAHMPLEVEAGKEIDLTEWGNIIQDNLSAAGHTFGGWTEAKYSSDTIDSIEVWGNTRIYAYWQPTTYTVNFTFNNGTLLSSMVLSTDIPENLPDKYVLFDKETANKLSAWAYENLDFKKNGNSGVIALDHMICNLLSTDMATCSLSAKFIDGTPPSSSNLTPKYGKVDPNYHYEKGTEILASPFRVVCLDELGNVVERTPVKIAPSSIDMQQYVTLYITEDKSVECFLRPED